MHKLLVLRRGDAALHVDAAAGTVRCYAIHTPAGSGRQHSRHIPCSSLPAAIRSALVADLALASAVAVDALAGQPPPADALARIAASLA